MPIPEFDALRHENMLYLTTVGRKTGKPRTIEIWFVSYEERIYLLAEHGLKAQWVRNRVHHDLGYTVPFMKGGTSHVTVSGSLNLYHRRLSFDERDRKRVYSAGTPFRVSILGRHG